MENTRVEWHHIENGYTMKVRLYLNKSASKVVDNYFTALEKAANITLWELKLHNPDICRTGEDGTVWPNFSAMAKANWLNKLREQNELVAALPGSALSSSVGGLFLADMKKAWEKQGKLPVDAWFEKKNKKGKPALTFYGSKKSKESFFLQITAGKFEQDECGRIYVTLPKGLGKARIRGWYENITFGECGVSFFEYYKDNLGKALSCRISKNNVGEFYLTMQLQDVNRRFKVSESRVPVGLDVNVNTKYGVASSRGEIYENKRFRQNNKEKTDELHRRLSRRYGQANEIFRKDASEIRKHNKDLPYEERLPLPEPSKRYKKVALLLKKAALSEQRKRDLYQHEIAAKETGAASLIGIESLNVTHMLKDDNIASAISDAAFSSQLEKLSYKCKWGDVPIIKVGEYFPSSQICPTCGHEFTGDEKHSLSVRNWTCPECGSHWNTDEAAAEVIKQEAIKIHEHPELYTEIKKEPQKNSHEPIPDKALDKKHPDILIHYDKSMREAYKNPWIVIDKDGTILDDAQGYGFATAQKAKKCYRHKLYA
jgi:transposase